MSIKEIYQGVYEAVAGICDKVYLKDRPKSVPVDNRPDSYIVIRLPYAFMNMEISDDGSYNSYNTTLQLELYVRDRVSADYPNRFDVLRMDEKLRVLTDRFPIVCGGFVASGPVLTMQTDDGDGFSVSFIQSQLRTK
jgi:hypothetical protein